MRETLFDFASNELYNHISKLGDRLNHVKEIIDWERFRPILSNLYYITIVRKKVVVQT